MLAYLRVRNLGVLEDVAIEPGPGFTVISGETGAGKTMLLGALRLLMGEKPRANAVGPFGEETVSEGLFQTGDSELGLTRVVPRDGRSRAYLDGNLVSAATLGEHTQGLVEIVGQGDHVLLRRSQTVLSLVDAALDEGGRAAKQRYEKVWEGHHALLEEQRRVGGDRMALERELDLVRYQAGEIEAAALQSGDDVRMETTAARLRNVGMIRENLGVAAEHLGSIGEAIGEVVSALRKIGRVDDESEDMLAPAEVIAEENQSLLRAVRATAEAIDEDPEALELLEQRLTMLGELKRKYGRTLDEVLQFGSEASDRASELEILLTRAANIDDLIAVSAGDLSAAGSELSEERQKAVDRIEDEARGHLSALGLPEAALRFEVTTTEPGASGTDRVELLFASDQRLQAGSVQDVASGGELSRLVLALRLATRSTDSATLVFDEVDAGVGGATALALGRKLADLAKNHQVLCVTHLPQVAAQADIQYVIERSGNSARVRKVEGDDRLGELSRMLAGLPESERTREAAAELLEDSRSA